jgi:hypothetical protein
MLFLAIFGDDVEEAMGSLRFVAFYLVSGIVAALTFTASSPHSLLPLIGASGAIAGVLAAYLMFRPCHKVMVFIPYILLWFVLRPIARLDAFWVLGGWANPALAYFGAVPGRGRLHGPCRRVCRRSDHVSGAAVSYGPPVRVRPDGAGGILILLKGIACGAA